MAMYTFCLILLLWPSLTSSETNLRERDESTVTNLAELVEQEGETDLLKLLQTSGIEQTLTKKDVTMTLFGPTNKAFAVISPEMLKLLQTNVTFLRETLEYHILPTKLLATSFKNDMMIKSVSGKPVRVNVYSLFKSLHDRPTVVTVSGRLVSRPDVLASNGVLHEVGGVLFPPAGSMYTAISSCPNLTILTKMMNQVGVVDILNGDGPLTIFAPTDAAFGKLPADTMEHLWANTTNLEYVLLNHLVAGTYYTAGFLSYTSVQYIPGQLRALNGEEFLKVNSTSTGGTVNGYRIDFPDISVTNGVVHGMETVLLPKTP